VLGGGARAAGAQPAAGALPAPPAADTTWALVGIGTTADQARRDAQLVGAAPAARRLFRSPSSEPDAGSVPARGWRPIYPQVRSVWNSDVPYSENDGTLWGGRGTNVRVRGGAALRSGRARIVIAPEVSYSANRAFDLPPGNVPGRSTYASPYYTGLLGRGPAADLPLRYGDRAFTNLDLGQSSVTVDAGPVSFGGTTEAEWWGPGVRTAIALSTAAAGIPRAFVRTRRPVRTAVGDVEARWFAGTLVKSPFFDPAPESRWRSVAAAAVSLAPRGAPGLTVGASRLVVRTARTPVAGLLRPLDVLGYWEPAPRADAVEQPTPGAPAATAQTRADQVLTFSARQVFPEAGSRCTASGGGSTCRARCASSRRPRTRARPTCSGSSGSPRRSGRPASR
jgi:hypothetical protein